MNSFTNTSSYSSIIESNIRTFIPRENNTAYIKELCSSDINSDIKLINSSNVSIEFLINKNFENELLSNFHHRFIQFMMFDEIMEDYSNAIELELLDYLDRNSYVTGQWFSKLFIEFIKFNKVLINLLKILAKLDSNKIPNTHLCIGTLLSNNDIEVKDFALRVFESWGDYDSLSILESSAELAPKWLEDYKQSVIKDIKKFVVN
ncbi:TPA: hypothetical protein ACX3C4_000430 [Pasteurella multocida]